MLHRWRGAVMAAAVVLVAAGCTGGGGARTTSARVDYVNGDVTVNGAAVEPGATIPAVFTVVTAEASSIGIVFNEKNILHVDESSEAYIDLAADVRTVELRRGTLASALRKLAAVSRAEEDRFRVKTPSAVAGVRGTYFFLKVEDPATTYVCTCNGTLHLHDGRQGNPFEVRAAHHDARRFALQGETVEVSTAEMLYHTDQMMELGASRIGETIDWSRVDG